METRDRAKTRHTSVETDPTPRHEKPCLETTDVSLDSLIDNRTHDRNIPTDRPTDHATPSVTISRINVCDAA